MNNISLLKMDSITTYFYKVLRHSLRISFLFVFFALSSSVQADVHYDILNYVETDDCLISFIECLGNKFVIKQIKEPVPDEQFLLVLDTLGCPI